MKFVTDLSKGVLGKPDSNEMWEEIISHISDEQLLKPDYKVLVIGVGHGTEAVIIAKRMLALGINKDKVNNSIYLIDKYIQFTNALTVRLGFTNVILSDFLEWETDMKFDNIIGNPPYSKGSKKLYRYFFEKAINMADEVMMIMPLNLHSKFDSLTVLNNLIQKHNRYISDNVSHYFDVGLNNIHYVIASKSIENIIKPTVELLDDYIEIMTERDRFNPILGNTPAGFIKNYDESGPPAITKVLKTGPVIKNIKSCIAESATQRVKAPFMVFHNNAPSLGKFNIFLLKNNQVDMIWTQHVFGYEFQTEESARKFADWLANDIITKEVAKMLLIKKKHTVSLTMLRKLPWYE